MRIDDLAAEFGTPTYVYDLADVRRARAELAAALPAPSRVLYSVKANPHPDVVGALARMGCGAEVASVGEVAVAAAAGLHPGRMLMVGPGKSARDVAAALDAGLTTFSVDSPTDLARIGDVAARRRRRVRCLLRVNADRPVPGMALTMTGTASPFGADASWILAEPDRFRTRGWATVAGLHLYMGTNLDDPAVLERQLAASIELAGALSRALATPLDTVDLGGGFAARYARAGDRPRYPHLAARLARLLDRELPGWRSGAPRILFESGRYLVGGCGTLLCRVLDVKVSKGDTFVVLDSGVHHLGGMSGLRRLPRVVPDLVPPRHRAAEDRAVDCTVVGPLCTPLDVWSRGVRMVPPRPGDLVTVPNVGAYGLTAGLVAFLGHPAAAEVVVDGDRVVSASRLSVGRVAIPAGGSAARPRDLLLDQVGDQLRPVEEAVVGGSADLDVPGGGKLPGGVPHPGR